MSYLPDNAMVQRHTDRKETRGWLKSTVLIPRSSTSTVEHEEGSSENPERDINVDVRHVQRLGLQLWVNVMTVNIANLTKKNAFNEINQIIDYLDTGTQNCSAENEKM